MNEERNEGVQQPPGDLENTPSLVRLKEDLKRNAEELDKLFDEKNMNEITVLVPPVEIKNINNVTESNKEKIKLRGGVEKYNHLSELYRGLKENPENKDIRKELVWEEYLGVRTLIYGTEKTAGFLNDLTEDARQKKIDLLCSLIFGGSKEGIYLLENLTETVFYINFSIAEGKQKLDTQEQKDEICSNIVDLIPNQEWRKKDFSLIFIEPNVSSPREDAQAENIMLYNREETTSTSEEQRELIEGMQVLKNLFEAVHSVYDEEKMQSPHFIHTIENIQTSIIDYSKNNDPILMLTRIGDSLWMRGGYSPKIDSPIGQHSLEREELNKPTYTLFSVAFANLKRVFLEKFHITICAKRGFYFNPSVHIAFDTYGNLGENRILDVYKQGFKFANNHPNVKLRGVVIEKAHVTKGDIIGDDRQLDQDLKSKYENLLTQKIHEIEAKQQNVPTHEIIKVADTITQPPAQEKVEGTVAPANVPTETEDEKRNREEGEQEKQKAITILQAFYQEQKHNTPTHTKMADAIEEMKTICERSLKYYPDMLPNNSDFLVDTDWEYSDSAYKEIVVSCLSKTNERVIITNPIVSLQELSERDEYKYDSAIEKLIHDYKRVSEELLKLRSALWEERKTIARNLLSIGFDQYQNQKFLLNDAGLYSTDGFLWIDDNPLLAFTQMEGYYSEQINKNIQSLQDQFHISNDELENIQKIEWSGGEKEKVQSFLQAVEEVPHNRVKQDLLREDFVQGIPFTENEIDNMTATVRRALIRALYRNEELPPQLESRVVEEVILGTFSF